MVDVDNKTLPHMGIFNGYSPNEGSQALSVVFDFTANTSYGLNLKQYPALGKMSGVQSVYIDNSGNNQPLTIQTHVFLQSVTCPAGAQGYFPLLCAREPSFTVSLPALGTNAVTRLQFLNVPVPSEFWFVNGSSSGGGTLGNNADAVAPVSTGLNGVDAFSYGWNGTGWDRLEVDAGKNLYVDLRNAAGNVAVIGSISDGVSTQNGLFTYAFNSGYNGATWDRLRSGGNNADAIATSSLGVLSAQAYGYLWNGGAWDRARTAAGAVGIGAATGVQAVANFPGQAAALNIAGATVVKSSAGRCVRVSVLVAGAAGTVNDVATTGAASIANQIFTIPATVGVYEVNWPCGVGIVVIPGAGQTVAVCYQ